MHKKSYRVMLEMIVDFMNKADEDDSRKLWDVLTALRGPDSDALKLKDATTAVVRHKLGLLSRGNFITAKDSPEAAAHRNESMPRENRYGGYYLRDYNHFSHHAYQAFKALGLEWNKENK